MREPDLSVVLVVADRRRRGARALRSILAQDVADRIEVLLMDVGSPVSPPLEGSDHPSVRACALGSDVLFSRARAEGVRRARGRVVAFLEEHCVALPGWARALLEAHDGPWAGVGAEVHAGPPGVLPGDARNLTTILSYAPWLPPAPRGEAASIPGHNSSYKREDLARFGGDLDGLLRSDLALQESLLRDGRRLFLEPGARFVHLDPASFRDTLRGVRLFSHCSVPVRARALGWGPGRRASAVLLSPLLPGLRAWRSVRAILRRSALRRAAVLRAVPKILVFHASAVWGQTCGLLIGAGGAEAGFHRMELSDPRVHDDWEGILADAR